MLFAWGVRRTGYSFVKSSLPTHERNSICFSLKELVLQQQQLRCWITWWSDYFISYLLSVIEEEAGNLEANFRNYENWKTYSEWEKYLYMLSRKRKSKMLFPFCGHTWAWQRSTKEVIFKTHAIRTVARMWCDVRFRWQAVPGRWWSVW